MNAQFMSGNTPETDERWIYRVGGVAALVFAITYLVIVVLYVPVGRPTGAEPWLMSMAENTTRWWAIVWLDVMTDFLLVPVALTLYLILKKINRPTMLLATVFVGLFIFLDLALTWTNINALLVLGSSYATATSDAQKTVLVTAAMYPSTVIESNLIFVYNSLTLAVGILLTGLVMLKGNFGRLTTGTALLTGVLGIVAVTSSFFSSDISGISIILATLFTTAWAFLVGYKLLRFG